MTPSRARLVLLCGLILGTVGDIVVRGEFWPLGFVVCVLLSVGALLMVGWPEPFRFDASEESRDRLLLAGGMVLASCGLVLRDAGTILFFDTLALLSCAALLVWSMRGAVLRSIQPGDLSIGWWEGALAAGFGMPLLVFKELELPSAAPTSGRKFRAILLGLILAVPPILLVASLLGEADPAFGKFLDRLAEFGITDALQHLMVAAAIAWPVTGWLRGASRPREEAGRWGLDLGPKIDFFGVAPALYGVAILLAGYLAFQARALFGGAAYVEATTGLTFAEYARRGFFELVAVTAIVLAVLLVADWALDREDGVAARRFRATGWVVVALVGILMVSALQRMWTYMTYFGLSDTRLYATAGMTWLGVAVGWFGWTILRGDRARFGFGLLIASAAWVATLNVINPEAIVVRVNLGRALAGAAFDIPYHAALSPDAYPAVIAAAAGLPTAQCRELVGRLHDQWHIRTERAGVRDWRSWSLPRSRMTEVMEVPVT